MIKWRIGSTVISSALSLLLLAISSSADQWPLESNKTTKVDAAVAREMEAQDLVGVGVGVLQEGQVVYCRGYGLANRENEIPFTTSTIVNWASNSKPVMAVAALQLTEKGFMDLESSVRVYLPELPEDYDAITVRHLLCHQSGYPHYSNGTIKPLPDSSGLGTDREDPLHSLRRFAGSPLNSKPGERYSYSSYAYVILSAVVQRAGKQPAMGQLESRILRPLGLESFQLDNTFRGQKHWSVGYNRRKGTAVESIEDYANYWKHGAGAYKSNIVDFSKWAQAFMNGKLLAESTTKAMWTPQKTSSGEQTNMGLGVFVTNENNTLKISHDGSHNEARSRMVFYPDRKHGVVAFSNCGHAEPARISTAIYRALAD